MNPKIDKLAREIEKIRARITDDQTKLKELERQKTDLENTEVVNLFRSVDIAPGELAAILKAYKDGSVTAAAPDPDYHQADGYNRIESNLQEVCDE